jgi:predicted aspartyl protease
MHRFRTILLLAAMLSPTSARSGRQPEEMPFRLVHGFAVVVQGEIGALKNLNFIIDTGSVPSIINQRVAKKLGISGMARSFALVSKQSEADYGTAKEVRLGWVRKIDLPIAIVDLSNLERLLDMRIDAIIGLDAFSYESFGIDYRRGKITKGLSGLARHKVAAEILTADNAPYWVLPVEINGRRLRMLLDTGADEVKIFADRRVESVSSRSEESTAVKMPVTGVSTAKHLLAPPPLLLVMDDVTFKKTPRVEMPKPAGALGDVGGLLAPRELRITRIEFDWENKRLLWDAE